MLNIAIDGPSGAGKSTIAKAIAKELGILYLDTGAMYRAMGLKAVRLGVACTDEEGVKAFLPDVKIEVGYQEDGMHIFLDGEDVSKEIREHYVSKCASDISKIPAVRLKLVELQRQIAAANPVVLDGRDITSYVLPNANCKFFLTASPEIRAQRRTKELIERGQTADYDKILADIIDRDYNDSHRSFCPLTQTEDSVLIDSGNLTIEEVKDKMMAVIKEHLED